MSKYAILLNDDIMVNFRGENTGVIGSMCTLFKILPNSNISKIRKKYCHRPLSKSPIKVFECKFFERSQ